MSQPADPSFNTIRELLQSLGVYADREVFGQALSPDKLPHNMMVFYLSGNGNDSDTNIIIIGEYVESGLLRSISLRVVLGGFQIMDDSKRIYESPSHYAKCSGKVLAKPHIANAKPYGVFVKRRYPSAPGESLVNAKNEIVYVGGHLTYQDGTIAGYFIFNYETTDISLKEWSEANSLCYVDWGNQPPVWMCTSDARQEVFSMFNDFKAFCNCVTALHDYALVTYDSILKAGIDGDFAPKNADTLTESPTSTKSYWRPWTVLML